MLFLLGWQTPSPHVGYGVVYRFCFSGSYSCKIPVLCLLPIRWLFLKAHVLLHHRLKLHCNISFLLHLYMQHHAFDVTIHVLTGLFAMMFSINVCFPMMHVCSFCIILCDTIVFVYIHASDMQGF